MVSSNTNDETRFIVPLYKRNVALIHWIYIDAASRSGDDAELEELDDDDLV